MNKQGNSGRRTPAEQIADAIAKANQNKRGNNSLLKKIAKQSKSDKNADLARKIMDASNIKRRKAETVISAYKNQGLSEVAKDETVEETKYVIDNSRAHFIFPVIPMGKIRMTHTQSRLWKRGLNAKREADAKKNVQIAFYFHWVNNLRFHADKLGYKCGDKIDNVYFIPMPDSWSQSRKEKSNGTPCRQKPDIDNIDKAFLDALHHNDKEVWSKKSEKRWAYRGAILAYVC